ncbi:MAG: carbonic anhydrase, partial [Gemmataceae bacterium]
VHIEKDLPKDPAAALAKSIRANVEHQRALLTKDSAILKELAASKRIKIVGGIYDLKTGKVEWLE